MALLIEEFESELDTEVIDELDITLADIAELLDGMGDGALLLSSPPQPVNTRLTRSAGKTIEIFFIAFTYCTVTVTRATGFSQR